MKVKIHLLLVPLLALTLVATALLAPQTATTVRSGAFGNNILARNMDIELGRAQPGPHEQLLSSGVIYTALQASGELDRRAAAVARTGRAGPAPLSSARTQGCQNSFNGGGADGGRNIRVNQDCSLRRQAEEVIVVNPTNPRNLIAGQNDSRIGFNHCGYDWSFDGGNTWGDQVPPFWQFQLLDGHTADACSDPSVTFDANGNAYITGILFDITSAANAIVVAKSNAGIGGAFYHSPAPGPSRPTVMSHWASWRTTITPISPTIRSSSSRTPIAPARRRTTST